MTQRVVSDGPVNVSDGESPEGGPGDRHDVGVGDVRHGPEVPREVVADDGPLYPHVLDDGLRGVEDGVGRVECGILAEPSKVWSVLSMIKKIIFQRINAKYFKL